MVAATTLSRDRAPYPVQRGPQRCWVRALAASGSRRQPPRRRRAGRRIRPSMVSMTHGVLLRRVDLLRDQTVRPPRHVADGKQVAYAGLAARVDLDVPPLDRLLGIGEVAGPGLDEHPGVHSALDRHPPGALRGLLPARQAARPAALRALGEGVVRDERHLGHQLIAIGKIPVPGRDRALELARAGVGCAGEVEPPVLHLALALVHGPPVEAQGVLGDLVAAVAAARATGAGEAAPTSQPQVRLTPPTSDLGPHHDPLLRPRRLHSLRPGRRRLAARADRTAT